MKILLLLSVAILLSACKCSQLTYAQASYLCEKHGGLYSVRFFEAICRDGTSFSGRVVSETIIPVEEVRKYYDDSTRL